MADDDGQINLSWSISIRALNQERDLLLLIFFANSYINRQDKSPPSTTLQPSTFNLITNHFTFIIPFPTFHIPTPHIKLQLLLDIHCSPLAIISHHEFLNEIV